MHYRITIIKTGFYPAKLIVTMTSDRNLNIESKIYITELMIKIVF